MSFKLLEISILSAQGLAPVSKLLRTYAVGWLHPDHKLTTTVDLRGGNNPVWNYRLLFPVHHHLLSSSAALTLTVQIFNVSWLRHIPVGTAHAPVSALLPPQSSTTGRFLSLPIRRPSGALHGTINLGINLIDSARWSLNLESEIAASVSTFAGCSVGDKRSREEGENKEKHENAEIRKLPRSQSDRTVSSDKFRESDAAPGANLSFGGEFGKSEEELEILKIQKLRRSQSDRTESVVDDDNETSVFSGRFRNFTEKTGSISSFYMRPLPSEVVAGMAKGLYSTKSSEEVGSSVLENWTVVGGGGELQRTRSKVVRWKNEDQYAEDKFSKKKSNGWGLLSCFGMVCGYQCNIVCGVPKTKKKNKNINTSMNKFGANQSAENLRLLYR